MSDDQKAIPLTTTTGETLQQSDIKIILLGDSAVGKSKLVERYLMDSYQRHQLSTFALTVFRSNLNVEGQNVIIDFWDTAGQERFNSMHPSYYFGAHACIMVFDVTRKVTYQNLETWYRELRQYSSNMPCFVVANKIDVNYEVTKKAFAFPSKYGLPFDYVSAADGTNVVKVFQEAVKLAWKFKQDPGDDFMESVLQTVQYLEQSERQRQGN
eukprot:TRINITY_DN1493_c0_g1_i1.p1 TRINITY_DN1493_c0_g1~~TRINITY_DN1493_c0_g1_i1.p1  ORF type:complete len:232 (+),score=48.56 TRINITY_DN1493_c0_g1_i1:62-697(+)